MGAAGESGASHMARAMLGPATSVAATASGAVAGAPSVATTAMLIIPPATVRLRLAVSLSLKPW